MTGAGKRNKGAAGERELARLLSDHLGQAVARNLEQSRSGGHDLTGTDGWSIEVKRQERLNISAWWAQAVVQAEKTKTRPALAYRQSRRSWRFMVRLSDINADYQGQPFTAELCVEGFAMLVRENLTFSAKK